jgi:hypothetical protein
MKIKKAFDICKKNKNISIFCNDVGEQWLSDGYAVYPIFALVAEQLVYIKHRKNMQSFIKSKVESKEGVSMDDKTEFVRMATTQCLKYMSVNEANKVEQILSVLLTEYSLKKKPTLYPPKQLLRIKN